MSLIHYLIFSILLIVPIFLGFNRDYLLFFDYFSLIIFLVFIWLVTIKEKKFFILSFYTFFAFITTIVISLILEHGTYLLEINEFSYAVGLTSKGAATGFFFISFMLLSFKTLNKTNISVINFDTSTQKILFNLFRLVTLAMCSTMLFLLILYGFPLFKGIHRADYWASYAPSWGGVLAFWLIQLSFLIGYIFSKTKARVDLCIFVFLLSITVLAGSRFTGILQSLVYFCIPVFISNSNFKIYNPKLISSFIVFIIIMMGIVLNSFETTSKSEQKNNLALRVVLQSQMWWALDNLATYYPRSSDEIIKSYIGTSHDPREKSYNYLMYLVAPVSLVNDKVDTDSRFTMSGFFNNYYFFGYFLGFIVNLIQALFFGLIVFLLYLAILSNNTIFLLFTFKLYTKVESILFTGNVDDLFSLNFIIFTFIVFIFLRVGKKNV